MKRVNKTNLDERQELILLKIEHNAFWLAFWALFASILIQMIRLIRLDGSTEAIAGEFLVFSLMAAYMTLSSIRHGIWDRHLKPDLKTNLFVSLIAGLFIVVVQLIQSQLRYPGAFLRSISASLITGFITCLISFLALTIFASIMKRKQQKLEAEEEENME